MKILAFFVSLVILVSGHIKAQEITYSDSVTVEEVKAKTRLIYDTRDHTDFVVTRKKLHISITSGLNIIAHSYQGTINRIITSGYTKDGLLSTEWYFSEGKLIHVYQTLEFFEESETKSNWKNFKNLWSAEIRLYFKNNELVFHSSKGVEYNINEQGWLDEAALLLSFLQNSKKSE